MGNMSMPLGFTENLEHYWNKSFINFRCNHLVMYILLLIMKYFKLTKAMFFGFSYFLESIIHFLPL